MPNARKFPPKANDEHARGKFRTGRLTWWESGEYSLFAHPVAGNGRLLRNPYRTVVLTQTPAARRRIPQDRQTAFINRALNKAEDIEYGEIPAGTHADYATVDFELFKTAMNSAENGEWQESLPLRQQKLKTR